MRTERIITILLFITAAAIPCVAHDYVSRPAQDKPVLLKGGTVHTVSGEVLEGTDVLFDEGKIVALGTNLELPEGTVVVDVAGRNVYPGLIAPATTVGLEEIGAVRATRDSVEVGSVTPEVLSHVAYNPDSEIIPTIRSNGIAVAQVAPRGSMLRGRSFITNLDGWTREDAGISLVDGLWLSWPSASLNGPDDAKERNKRLEELEKQRNDVRQAFGDARAYLKRKSTDPKLPVDLRWEAMLPALRGEQTVYVAAEDVRQIREVIRFAGDEQLRVVLVGGQEAYLVGAELREAGIPVILSEVTDLPMRQDDGYDQAYRNPARLDEAGVKFCLSSPGSWNSRNLPLEAGHAVSYGLSKEKALRAITLSAAEILGVSEELGSIEVGKRATLVVSEGDIMDTIGHKVTHMWIDGREVDLDNKQKELWRKYRQKP